MYNLKKKKMVSKKNSLSPHEKGIGLKTPFLYIQYNTHNTFLHPQMTDGGVFFNTRSE